MKATIITLAAVAVLSIGSVFASNKEYTNVVGSKESGAITSTMSKGSSAGKNLKPTLKNVSCYNADKTLKERYSYKWDADKNDWALVSKHTYEYSAEGKLVNVAYSQWNESKQAWGYNNQYTTYIYDGTNCQLVKCLAVKEKINQ